MRDSMPALMMLQSPRTGEAASAQGKGTGRRKQQHLVSNCANMKTSWGQLSGAVVKHATETVS